MNDVLPTLISIGGWIGAAEFLLAYALVSKGRIAGDSLRYQALNLSASALLLINCAHTGAWPSAIANVFFIIIERAFSFWADNNVCATDVMIIELDRPDDPGDSENLNLHTFFDLTNNRSV